MRFHAKSAVNQYLMHTETPQDNDNNSSDNYRFSSSRQIKELKEKNVGLAALGSFVHIRI